MGKLCLLEPMLLISLTLKKENKKTYIFRTEKATYFVLSQPYLGLCHGLIHILPLAKWEEGGEFDEQPLDKSAILFYGISYLTARR